MVEVKEFTRNGQEGIYPEIIRQGKDHLSKARRKYLLSRAAVKLRKHFTAKETAIIMQRSERFIFYLTQSIG
jgi:hypothetical protein